MGTDRKRTDRSELQKRPKHSIVLVILFLLLLRHR